MELPEPEASATLAIIRAFVERVEARMAVASGAASWNYEYAVKQELAAWEAKASREGP